MNGADTTRGTVDEDVGPRAFGTFCRWPDWRNDVVGGVAIQCRSRFSWIAMLCKGVQLPISPLFLASRLSIRFDVLDLPSWLGHGGYERR